MIAGVIETKSTPIFADVSIGERGPYRFLVDTGAQSSSIDEKLARKLSLKPQFRVEVLTLNGSHLVPGMKTRGLKLGDRALPEIELLIQDLAEARKVDASIQGVLGINALAGSDFTLSPPTSRLENTEARPSGEVVPFTSLDGCIAIKARMGSEALTLILDSGANHIVFFHKPAAMASTPPVSATVSTMEGARRVVPTVWTAELTITDRLRIRTLPAGIVDAAGMQADGLLPVSVFKKIYVDQTRHELVLVR